MLKTLRVRILNLKYNPLVKGSGLMMGSGLIVNFLNYLFNVLIVRFLGPANYGVYASLISLLTVVSIPTAGLAATVSKFSSDFRGSSRPDKIVSLYSRLLQIFLAGGFVVLFFFILFSRPIQSYLNIAESLPVWLVGFSFIVIFPQTATLGVLQGLQYFFFLSVSSVFSSLLKLVFGLGLVVLGFSVSGALFGFFLAALLPFLVSLYVLRQYYQSRASEVDWKPIFQYMPAAIFAILGLSLLSSLDIILVKHYFSPHEAGIYSAVSLVGRVVLFVSSPISVVMFPLIAEKHSAKKSYHQDLYLSLFLVGFISVAVTTFYFFFPAFSMNFFFGKKFLEAAPYLSFFGLSVTFYSLSNILVTYFLSVRKVRASVLPLVASFLQLVLIFYFHRNFWQVIGASVLSVSLLTLALLLYLVLDEDFRGRSRLQAGEND